MIWYYNQLVETDGILYHNDIDVPYYEGITGKPAFILPTLMIEEGIMIVDDEQLLVNLGKQLESAGADVLAPSDMGENTVKNLKAETSKLIMAYVKWRSVFYSTFRDVSDSKPSSERTYQLNVKNEWGMTSRSHQYVADGADALLLKPASHSMDVFGLVKAGTYKQVGLFQVSDEYVGLPTIQHQLEIATIYKRANASFLVTYGARNLVNKLE